jgi:hypothetical protein
MIRMTSVVSSGVAFGDRWRDGVQLQTIGLPNDEPDANIGRNLLCHAIERAGESRKNREKDLAQALAKNSLDALSLLRDWELAYRKECFYYGIRALMELERNGKTKL